MATIICLVRGNRELNRQNPKAFKRTELNFANDELIATSNAVPGYTGQLIKCHCCTQVLTMKNFL